jgi:hypothetical protein
MGAVRLSIPVLEWRSRNLEPLEPPADEGQWQDALREFGGGLRVVFVDAGNGRWWISAADVSIPGPGVGMLVDLKHSVRAALFNAGLPVD